MQFPWIDRDDLEEAIMGYQLPAYGERFVRETQNKTEFGEAWIYETGIHLTGEKMMKTLAGLWIDHREAVIVLVSKNGQETKRIKSGVEKQLRRSGLSPTRAPFESQMVPADDSREREYAGHLANYYDEAVSCLRTAEAILIFGPGEAKGELRGSALRRTNSIGASQAPKPPTR